MDVPPGAVVPHPVDARGTHCMVELKHDDVVHGQLPKLHDKKSGIAVRSHSMDGVLFCAGSLDGLWLIHDNYPSSIPLFYIVWDTLRNLT